MGYGYVQNVMGYGYGEMCSEGMSATRRITCECQTSSTMALLMSLYHVVS